MNLFIKSARIIDPASSFHNQTKDLVIQKGVITEIGNKLKNDKGYKEISGENICVSPGWLDMFSFFGDPGFEYKEDIVSGTKAAAAGGFTMVCCMPNTYPALDSKSEIEYVINKSAGGIVDVRPIGAVSHECKGEDITEIYDMKEAGAVAFSDGVNSSVNAGLMLKTLLYVKPFNGLVISHPDDKTVRNEGVMNEGKMSTALGLAGIPSVSEELIVMRDIYLAEYTGSRIHFAYISSAGAVDLIRKAKARGIQVSCSVSPYNLMLEDEVLEEYDTNYKVLPPLKSKTDIDAIISGLKDNTIDNIASMHIPQDTESKKVEFDYAEFGMLGLETAFAVINSSVGKKVGLGKIVEKLAIAPRKILGLPVPIIAKNETANITIFDSEVSWEFDKKNIQSKSKNTPFIGRTFKGKVLGVVNNNQIHLN